MVINIKIFLISPNMAWAFLWGFTNGIKPISIKKIVALSHATYDRMARCERWNFKRGD